MDLVIRRYGTMIDVSPDGKNPLPQRIINDLSPLLSYVYREALQGADAYDPVTGQKVTIRLTPKQLYCLQKGKLVCGYGFTHKIATYLTKIGHNVSFLDITPLPEDRPKCYTPHWEQLERYITFRAPQQRECLEAIVESLGGVVTAPTGFGKTTLMASLAVLFPQARIDIVVAGKSRVETGVRALTRYIPNVGQVGGGVNKLNRVTVFSADSLHLSAGDADFLLCDEVHELMAPTYSAQLAQKYRFSRNYGFSASPYGRFDGADAKLECLFGPEIFHMSYQEAVEQGLTNKIMVRWLSVDCDRNPCNNKTGVPKKRHGLWRNEERNARIARAAREYPDDVQVLILTETVEHAVFLKSLLPEYQLCYSEQGLPDHDRNMYIRWGLLQDDEPIMTAKRRIDMRSAFERGELKKVIATDVWSTGVDFEQLGVLIRADARESYTMAVQAPGRTSRIYEGKPVSEVIDFKDEFDPGFERKAKKRRGYYKTMGWEQTWVDPTRRRV